MVSLHTIFAAECKTKMMEELIFTNECMQARLEEERKRQERLRTEKNALYNRQRLDMEAQNFALLGSGVGEEQRGARLASAAASASAAVVADVEAAEPMSPRELAIVDRLKEQDKLREEHKREETQIRKEKLNLLQQEEMLIKRQEEMLTQVLIPND